MGYRFLEHTADVEFIASGKNLDAALRSAAEAMFDTIADGSMLSKKRTRKMVVSVRVRADNYTDLAWLMLQHLLSKASSMNLFLYEVESVDVKEMRNGRLLCRISAFGKEQDKESARTEVKAVSRYNIETRRTGNSYSVRAVLDI